jgi:hypothetical protein
MPLPPRAWSLEPLPVKGDDDAGESLSIRGGESAWIQEAVNLWQSKIFNLHNLMKNKETAGMTSRKSEGYSSVCFLLFDPRERV